MDSATATALLALVPGIAGVVWLRLGWRDSSRRGRVFAIGGWALTAVSLVAWSKAAGVEFGLSYALALLPIWGLAAVGSNASLKLRSADACTVEQIATSSARHKWLTFFSAGPLCALASCQFSLLVTLLMPVTTITQMAVGSLLFPIVWAGAAFWSVASARPGRNSLIFIATAGLSAAALRGMSL